MAEKTCMWRPSCSKMSNELLRVSSFGSFPTNVNISLVRLSKAGFYYSGFAKETHCFFCGVMYRNWIDNDNPIAVHQRISPGCQYIFDLINSTDSTQTDEFSKSDIFRRINEMEISNSHSRTPAEGPKYPNFASLEIRNSSFVTWPTHLRKLKSHIATSGFMFVGFKDYTKCFYCGIGLRNWDEKDDPWIEHAKWSPRCVFVTCKKGEGFIKNVLRIHLEQATERSTVDASNVSAAVNTQSIGLTGRNGTLTWNMETTGNIIAESDIESLVLENRELRKRTLCKQCILRNSTVVFLPCGHLVYCVHCAVVTPVCPVCKAKVARLQNVCRS